MGFFKGRQIENFTGRVLNIIYNIEKDKSKAGVLSLDIFKAFDCVEWPTLKIILKGWGFGKKFRGIIDQLYLKNISAVIVNDGMTQQIALGRYVDDTFAIWSHGEEKLEEFLNHINTIHQNIQLTMEKEIEGQLPFLDVMVIRKTDLILGHKV